MSLPAQATLAQLINGYWVTGAIVAAARLELADRLAEGPRTAAELAAETSTQEDMIFRLLRALASLGIFVETEPRTFAQTPLSEPLRKDVPGSMHGLAVMTGMLHVRAWAEMPWSLATGEPAFDRVFGAGLYPHLDRDAGAAAAFEAAMTGYTAVTSRSVAAAYDFSSAALVVDVGGGYGGLVAEIAKANADVRAIVLDRPALADAARALLAREGVADRCTFQPGDFFAEVPAGGDVYVMKMILHHLDDEQGLAVLRRVRSAMAKTARLLVADAVIPPGNAPAPGKLMDLNMMVMTGGRERTESEFRSLVRSAGFELVRVIPAHPLANLLELRPRS